MNKQRIVVPGRFRTRDHAYPTFDSANPFATAGTLPINANGDQMGKSFGQTYKVQDSQGNFRTVDSTGAFMVGELERLDQTMHEPLATVSWQRDIDLREDVSIADEVTSFTISTYASAGSLGTGAGIGNGKSWIGRQTNQIVGQAVDIGKIAHPLRPWGEEIKFTVFELESSAKMGRPIDQQKYAALQLKHQMDIDEQVYIGDLTTGDTGLLNNSLVTNISNFPDTGTGSSSLWANKTPDQILADVNEAITSVWTASAYAQMPDRILIPPVQFGLIATAKVSDAGNISILKYIKENNVRTTSGGGEILIFPNKWCVGAGAGGTIGTPGTVDRLVAYTKAKNRVRFPLTMLARTPIQYDSVYQKSTYYCKLGVVEVVYPETIGYFDGL
jgi:hypothetical protein